MTRLRFLAWKYVAALFAFPFLGIVPYAVACGLFVAALLDGEWGLALRVLGVVIAWTIGGLIATAWLHRADHMDERGAPRPLSPEPDASVRATTGASGAPLVRTSEGGGPAQSGPDARPGDPAAALDPRKQWGGEAGLVSDWTRHNLKPCWAMRGEFRCIDCGWFFVVSRTDDFEPVLEGR
jgi:hypothetical protein